MLIYSYYTVDFTFISHISKYVHSLLNEKQFPASSLDSFFLSCVIQKLESVRPFKRVWKSVLLHEFDWPLWQMVRCVPLPQFCSWYPPPLQWSCIFYPLLHTEVELAREREREREREQGQKERISSSLFLSLWKPILHLTKEKD